MTSQLRVICGDALEKLNELPAESVQCCVTSPPYWGLRDYGVNGQIGLEKTPDEYMAKMVAVFREVKRVLRKDGTLWLNLGDSYWTDSPVRLAASEAFSETWDKSQTASRGGLRKSAAKCGVYKNKDLVGIPWMVAFALRADGWYLRSDVIWAKANCMPESVRDRPTRSHEYIFLLTKQPKYFYDAEAIKEPASEADWENRAGRGRLNADGTMFKDASLYSGKNNGKIKRSPNYKDKQRGHSRRHDGFNDRWGHMEKSEQWAGMRNKRDVWTVAPTSYPEAHFATFPEELPKICILAGTSAKGCCAKCGSPWERVADSELDRYGTGSAGVHRNIGGQYQKWLNANPPQTIRWSESCACTAETIPCTVIDPFAGSGTTGAVAIEIGRSAILIELNPKYIPLIKQRCTITVGLPI